MNRKPLVDEDGEVRELTQDDIKLFKPSAEVLPSEHFKTLTKRGRPRKAQPKKSTTMRLEPCQIVEDNVLKRRETVDKIDALRNRLFQRYGQMPDSVDLIREDRAR